MEDLGILTGIVCSIITFVVGFAVWSKVSPRSRKPEQALFLLGGALPTVMGAIMVCRTIITIRETGLNPLNLPATMVLALFAAINWVGFVMSRKVERKERNSDATKRRA